MLVQYAKLYFVAMNAVEYLPYQFGMKMKIAYTIGNFKNYDEALATNEIVTKLGRQEDYCGGCIWKTKEEAQAFIIADKIMIDGTKRDNKKFAVYELSLSGNWNSDVSQDVDEDGVHMLLVDAVIVKKC